MKQSFSIALLVLLFSTCSLLQENAQGQGTFIPLANVTGSYTPSAGVVIDSNGNSYGTTSNGSGAVFEVTPTGVFTTLYAFSGSDGQSPYGTLIRDSKGDLFGTTLAGGTNYEGTVFELSPNSSGTSYTLATLYSFDTTTGASPYAGLAMDAAGNLYGTAETGGSGTYGVVYKLAYVSPGNYTYSVLHNFTFGDGANPYASLLIDSKGDLFGSNTLGGSGQGNIFELSKSSKTYTFKDLYDFDTTHGANPYGKLVEDSAGNLYGTTAMGGANSDGTAFELVKNAAVYTIQTLHSFDGTDGSDVQGGLAFDQAGDLYGTCYAGGTTDSGTVFELVKGTSGAFQFSTLHNFIGSDGAFPNAGLSEDPSGNFIGTAESGGSGVYQYGTVFAIVTQPQMSQTANLPNVPTSDPYGSPLPLSAVSSAGFPETFQVLSGSAYVDGNNNLIFSGLGKVVLEVEQVGNIPYSPATPLQETITVVKGSQTITFGPISDTTFGTPTNFYTVGGGSNEPVVVSISGPAIQAPYSGSLTPTGVGAVTLTATEAGNADYNAAPPVKQSFVISPAPQSISFNGNFKTIATVSSYPNGETPGNLIYGSDKNFYGATSAGGRYAHGTIFKVTPGGVETVLYNFQGTDGSAPYILQNISGTLYGYTTSGGLDGQGTLFSLTPSGTSYVFTTLYNFNDVTGSSASGIYLDASGNYFGVQSTNTGTGQSLIFKLTPKTSGGFTFSKVYTFSATDSTGLSGLISEDSVGNLYTTSAFEVFKLSLSGSKYTAAAIYTVSEPNITVPGLTLDSFGNVYGLTTNYGTVYKLTPGTGGTYSPATLYTFNPSGLSNPTYLIQDNAGNLFGTCPAGVFELSANSYTYSALYSLGDPNGYFENVTLDSTGNLYGTTYGGTSSEVFKLTKSKSSYNYSELTTFGVNNEQGPDGQLIQDAKGNLYGTTSSSVYKLTPNGSGGFVIASLHDFSSATDGAEVNPQLSFDKSGDIFGTSQQGGANGRGTVFEFMSSGSKYNFTVVHTFTTTEASYPVGGIVSDLNGNLFGMTSYGGVNQQGDVFQLVGSGSTYSLNTIYSFTYNSSGFLALQLSVDSSGNLYGNTAGEVFKLTYSGTPGSYTFSALTPNYFTYGNLTLDGSGNIYGISETGVFKLALQPNGTYVTSTVYTTTQEGNLGGNLVLDTQGDIFGLINNTSYPGSVYEVSAAGVFSTLYTFTGPDGSNPRGITLVGNNSLYGTTLGGGAASGGTCFQIATQFSVGQGPYTLGAIGGLSGSPIIYKVTSGPATLSNNQLTFTGAGTVQVSADQAGNSNYNAATEVTQSFVVAQ